MDQQESTASLARISPQGAEGASRALDATADLTELLRLAHSAVHRAQAEAHGDAYYVASRLSRHLQYMRKVSELLRHEIERFGAAPADPQGSHPAPTLKAIAPPRPTRLPLRVGVIPDAVAR